MDKVYNFKKQYMGNVPNNDPARVQDGTLTMTIEILSLIHISEPTRPY